MRILSLFISAFILFSTSVSAEQKEVKLYTIDILSPKGPNSGIPIAYKNHRFHREAYTYIIS